MTQYKCWPKKA